MDIRVLRYFLAAAEQQSISGAAQKLHVTQPTLSRQFMELEEELGHTLFVRTNRKLHLTEKGKLFYERAQAIDYFTNALKPSSVFLTALKLKSVRTMK